MNNEQFRRMLLANGAKPEAKKNDASPQSAARPAALGSRMKSSIPMTPRQVAGAGAGVARTEFSRQLAEQHRAFEKTQKKARTSAPKGIKLAQGYVDRAKTRQEQEEEDERSERLKALEESFKKEEIDQATYDRLRAEIAGGDLSTTHLVKGLDFKLLERIRKGEDVYGSGTKDGDRKDGGVTEEEDQEQQPESEEDPDEILDKLESTEVKAVAKEKAQKKGQFAPTKALNPGQKRSRDQILAELKAAREAAKAKQESGLGSKFKKIGAKKTPGTRIERDAKGREVMIIVDEDGHERRKVRKIDPKVQEEEDRKERELAALAQGKEVLGMEVPEFYRKQQAELEAAAAAEEEKEPAIFDDVESDYDPLAGLEDGSDSDSDAEGDAQDESAVANKASSTEMPTPPKPATPAARNYFKDSKTALTSEETYKGPSLNDATFLAALKKAKAISAAEKSEEGRMAAEREQRLKKKLLESSRDDEDLDMGFGSSRVEDEADFEDAKVKMSTWRGGEQADDDDDGDDNGGGGDGRSKRKRGGKKRKGDKNSFSDVMRVIERNKTGG
ncbi:hypothetical protein B0H66DRAFT_35412 [Apodospora peruviana]|uniref:RED-like N-terminal domain-containing protein n=1 Tax=Apodospora peruviana TaxID=516989 RepID=A0AAE0IQX7_9PEZI|nr:hypothetical protein B0H66DRAFT_35412 [Apodospora peruviana]